MNYTDILKYEDLDADDYMSPEEYREFKEKNKVGCGSFLLTVGGAILLIVILVLILVLAEKCGINISPE